MNNFGCKEVEACEHCIGVPVMSLCLFSLYYTKTKFKAPLRRNDEQNGNIACDSLSQLPKFPIVFVKSFFDIISSGIYKLSLRLFYTTES